MTTAIERRKPDRAIQVVEGWAGMADGERRFRAAQAIQADDRDELESLLRSYVLTNGRRGTDSSSKTLETYWRGAGKFLGWCAANGVKPHQVQDQEAKRFMASMADLAPSSRKVYQVGARTMVAALRWAGMGEGDPFGGVVIRDPQKPRDKAGFYQADEIRDLLEQATDRERLMILLGIEAGLRVAEVSAARWEWIDWRRRELAVTGKGGKVRKVPLSDRLLAALRTWRGDRRPRGAIFPGIGDEREGLSARRLQELIENLCRNAGVKHRGFHALRHTFGKRYYEATHDLVGLAELMGHSDTKTTEIYSHLASHALSDGIKAMEANGFGR